MIETLQSQYVTAARAKGLPENVVIRRHALRNALVPTITVLAIDVGLPHGRDRGGGDGVSRIRAWGAC
jgi:peptide/nickel transport system permease protein